MDYPEGVYARAVVAFVIVMMIAIAGLFGAMAFGLWYGHGVRITW